MKNRLKLRKSKNCIWNLNYWKKDCVYEQLKKRINEWVSELKQLI